MPQDIPKLIATARGFLASQAYGDAVEGITNSIRDGLAQGQP